MADPINQIKDKTRVSEEILVSSVVEAIYLMLTAKAPFLSWPILKTIFKFGLNKLMSWLSEQGIILFNTVWIRLEVGKEAERLEKARQDYMWAVDNELSQGEIDEIEKEMVDAFDDLVRIGRSRL